MERSLSEETRAAILRYQREELNGHRVYGWLAERVRDSRERAILKRIAQDEMEHAAVWRSYGGVEAKASGLKIFLYSVLSLLFGYTFVIKLMEKDEALTAREYAALTADIPEMRRIIEQEEAHEAALHDMLDEERLQYVGAMVLGLNDALVELTGTIAGLTLALGDNRVVALAGIITGVSATLSMAASNYLAERANENPRAFKSCLYTGIAYLLTVVCLVLPYLLFPAHMYLAALASMLAVVILIILFFNYYIAVAKSLPFWPRFVEMACISLGVAVVSFGIGLLAKEFLGVEL